MGPTIRASRTRRARDAAAQNKLGNRYHDGRGVTKDYTEALRWLHKSADQDDTYAETALGYMYFYGEGVPQDYAQALRSYQLAAEPNEFNKGDKHGKTSHLKPADVDDLVAFLKSLPYEKPPGETPNTVKHRFIPTRKKKE